MASWVRLRTGFRYTPDGGVIQQGLADDGPLLKGPVRHRCSSTRHATVCRVTHTICAWPPQTGGALGKEYTPVMTTAGTSIRMPPQCCIACETRAAGQQLVGCCEVCAVGRSSKLRRVCVCRDVDTHLVAQHVTPVHVPEAPAVLACVQRIRCCQRQPRSSRGLCHLDVCGEGGRSKAKHTRKRPPITRTSEEPRHRVFSVLASAHFAVLCRCFPHNYSVAGSLADSLILATARHPSPQRGNQRASLHTLRNVIETSTKHLSYACRP